MVTFVLVSMNGMICPPFTYASLIHSIISRSLRLRNTGILLFLSQYNDIVMGMLFANRSDIEKFHRNCYKIFFGQFELMIDKVLYRVYPALV